jgi:serine/threonine-protein kinase
VGYHHRVESRSDEGVAGDGTLTVTGRQITSPAEETDGEIARQMGAEAAALASRRYVPLDELARGGSGRVLRARDLVFGRIVALKEPLDAMTGAARLRTEASILAMLQHPSIVAIYDSGTHDGDVPFFAMKLVDGRPLRDELHAATTLERRLALVPQIVAVAEAVAYAHAQGVIHRDLKPSNVLVGRFGETIVIDWGLAKRFADESPQEPAAPTLEVHPTRTATGAVIGTPAYMPPEQARGEPVDTRADVYSLGAMLYELLAGAPPYAGHPGEDRLALIRSGAPAPIDHLQPRAPADLVAIARRAMARNAGDRYPTAATLVDDLVRFQTGRLVAARRYSPIARTVRWLRARRWWLAAALLAAVSAGVALVVRPTPSPPDPAEACVRGAEVVRETWDADHHDRGRAAAVHASFLASQQDDAFGRVAAQLDRYTRGWAAARIDACKATHVLGAQSQGLFDLRMSCLDRRRSELQSLVEVLAAGPAPGVLAKAIDATSALAPVADCSDAAALQALVPPPSDPAARGELASLRATVARAKALDDTGQYRDGLAAIQPAASAAERLAYAPLLAEALYRRASLEEHSGSVTAAEATLRRTMVAAADARDDRLVAQTWVYLMFIVGERLSRPDEALGLQLSAEAAQRRAGNESVSAAGLWNILGVLWNAKGKYDEGQADLERGLALREKLLGPDHPDVAASLANLGRVMNSRGDRTGGIRATERALAIYERAYGPDHPSVASMCNNLGAIHYDAGNYDAAVRYHERARALREKLLGPQHPQLASTLSNLGNALTAQGAYEQAIPLLERALAIYEKAFGPDHRNVAFAAMNLGIALLSVGRLDEALRDQARAVAIEERMLGRDHPDVARALVNYADVLRERHDFQGQLQASTRALQIFEKALGPDHADLAYPLTGQAQALVALGRPRDARAAAERAVRLRSTAPAGELVPSQMILARVLWSYPAEQTTARELMQQAFDAMRTMGRVADKERGEAEQWLRAHGATASAPAGHGGNRHQPRN